MKHDPTLYWAGRHGSWSRCSCGWTSRYVYGSVFGAHLAFGGHLVGRPEFPKWRMT